MHVCHAKPYYVCKCIVADFDSDVVGSGEGSGAYDDTEGC